MDKAGLTEQIGSEMQNWAGLSWVMQVGSPTSARAELAATISQIKSSNVQETYPPFAVKTIPGAIGYTLSGSGGAGDNIMFADGDYVFEVGFGLTHGTKRPARAILVAGAAKLYGWVHGHP
jgi:hypothetical protein